MSGIKVPRAPVRPAWRRWLASRRYEIVDRSMAPTLSPGDRVLVDRGAYRRSAPSPGDLVAADDPESPGRWLVKRVAAVGPSAAHVPIAGLAPGTEGLRVPVPEGRVFLLSDAEAVGRDSRRFGPVLRSAIHGQVWYRYAPRSERGRLDRPSGRPDGLRSPQDFNR